MTQVRTADVRAAGLRTSRATFALAAAKTAISSWGWASRAGLLAATATAGAVIGIATGWPVFLCAAAGALAALLVLLVVASPEAAKVAAIVAAYLPFAPLLGFGYTSLAWGISPALGDAAGGGMALLAALSAIAVLSLRFSRGAPWVTVLLAATASIFPGMLLAYAAPPLGVWAAWLPMAAVTSLRFGAWTVIARQWASRASFTSHGRLPRPLDSDTVKAVRLRKAPDGYALIAASGVAGAVVVTATGRARENERAGLSLPGVPDLSEYALKAVRAARATARLSGMPRQRVPAYVIVNDTHNAHVDRWMGVHVDGRDGASATVRLLGASAAKKVLADGAWKPTRRDKVAGLISVRVGRQKLR